MKKNMGTAGRIIRIVLAATVGVLVATQVLTGAIAVVLSVLAGIFLVTGIIGFCPLYVLFRISTLKK